MCSIVKQFQVVCTSCGKSLFESWLYDSRLKQLLRGFRVSFVAGLLIATWRSWHLWDIGKTREYVHLEKDEATWTEFNDVANRYTTVTAGCISVLLLAVITATFGCILLLPLAVFYSYFWLYFTATFGCLLLSHVH